MAQSMKELKAELRSGTLSAPKLRCLLLLVMKRLNYGCQNGQFLVLGYSDVFPIEYPGTR